MSSTERYRGILIAEPVSGERVSLDSIAGQLAYLGNEQAKIRLALEGSLQEQAELMLALGGRLEVLEEASKRQTESIRALRLATHPVAQWTNTIAAGVTAASWAVVALYVVYRWLAG